MSSFASFADDELLDKFCDLYGGQVQFGYKCPKSNIYLPVRFCVIKGDDGVEKFFDGCTGPTGKFASVFYPSCVKHDFCYHKEPVTSGMTQKECDAQLLEGLLESCNATDDYDDCVSWANVMYKAVRNFGKLAYNCANIRESNL